MIIIIISFFTFGTKFFRLVFDISDLWSRLSDLWSLFNFQTCGHVTFRLVAYTVVYNFVPPRAPITRASRDTIEASGAAEGAGAD